MSSARFSGSSGPDPSAAHGDGRTLGALLRQTEAALVAAGVDEARRTAEWLVEEATGARRSRLHAFPETPVAAADADRLAALTARRALGEPVQYVVGHADFFGLRLAVGPGVLIPRPETEGLVEHALASIRGVPSPRVLDAGTGSGAIALAIKAQRPDADVHALDVSPDALGWARRNGAALGLAVTFHEGDLLGPALPSPLPEDLDLLVSNPPYVLDAERPGLAREVAAHEPALALFCGDDPALFYRALARHGTKHLRPGGAVWLEGHADHAGAVAEAFAAPAYAGVRVHRDLAGLDRYVEARRV